MLIGIGLFLRYFQVWHNFVYLAVVSNPCLVVAIQHDDAGISGFQAFVTGLASRVGVGNVAGVAIAIGIGGAGAVFWMWLIALIGMCSALAESSLAQLFKVRDATTGQFRGGPAYYIEQGLGQNGLGVCLPWH